MLVHESCFGGARSLVPAKLERGGVGVLVVGRSSIGHPDLSLTVPTAAVRGDKCTGEGVREKIRGGDG